MPEQTTSSYVVKPVAAVLAVVLAVLGGFTLVANAPAASAEPVLSSVDEPTGEPSEDPGQEPTDTPTDQPSSGPSEEPGVPPTQEPSEQPSEEPSDEPTEEPSEEPTEAPTDPTTPPAETDVVQVDDAVFRWGINNQTNARSHNPGAFNFLSAGVANPGRGGVHLLEKHWNAKAGNVVIQKWLGEKKGWKRAVWNDWKTASDGKTATGVDQNFSLHNVVIRGGKGTVDRPSGTAEIRWKGTFTVVYYSGNTLFTVTDPVLTVRNGKGEVTAELGGWASQRDNMSQWSPVTPKRVTIANLPKVKLKKKSITATPTYKGVVARGFSDQLTSGPAWGAFPQSMLDFLGPLDIAQFWYSTGLSTDGTKLPLPITVSYDAAEEEPAPTPTEEPTAPEIVNETTAPPPVTTPQYPGFVLPNPAPIVPAGPMTAPDQSVSLAAPASAAGQDFLLTAFDLSAAVPAAAPTVASAADADRTWWAVGALLLLASMLLSIPSRPVRA